MKIYLIILLILTVLAGIAKAADPPFAIKLNNPVAVGYCTTPVLLAEKLTIEGTPSIKGMTISFSENYKVNEDELVYSGNLLTQSWSAATGTLELTGTTTTTRQEYEEAIRNIHYKNKNATPTIGVRKITISLNDVDYLSYTTHFYRYVNKPGMKWSEAKAEAESMTYYGLQGYLATITSKIENDFIILRTQGVGYIGATDKDVEGEWRWVTGPEGLMGAGKGLLFWKGTGAQAQANPLVYGPVNGAYSNWDRLEPNNTLQGTYYENYGHITVFQNDPVNSWKWNDVVDTGGTGDWAPKGYIIEFGGMPGDPPLEQSATLELQVNTMLFANKGTLPAICEGDSVKLNQTDTTKAIYNWTPAGYLSSATIANPLAKPKVTTTYFVTGTRGECHDTATYKVPVNPKPIVSLGRDTTVCNPANIVLNAGSSFANYQWLPNAETTQSINVTKNGNYSVNVTDLNKCKGGAAIKVSFTDKPKMIFLGLDTLICGKKSDFLDIAANKGSFTVERLSDHFIFPGLNVTVPEFGTYDLKIKATDQFSCYSDSVIKFGFHKTPTVDFSIDSTLCQHYNMDAKYIGDADTIKARFTWVFGGDTIADGLGLNKEKIWLGVNKTIRNLVLSVERNGCSGQYTISNIRVTPTLSLIVKDTIRCLPDAFEFSAFNTEKGVSYEWNFGDNSKAKGSVSSHLYAKPGNYDVQVTVTTDQDCSNKASIRVFAAPIPDIAFSLSSNNCLEPGVNEISYTGLIGTEKDKYYWDLKQFDKSEIIQDPLLAKGPFKFDLKTKPGTTLGLKVISEFGCKSLPGSILVKRKPDFSIATNDTAGCIPFSPLLSGIINDKVDRVNFTWNFGDGSPGTGLPHTYDQPGKKYTITLTGTSSVTGCPNVVTIPDFLQTFPKPKAAFSMDNTVVYNDKPDVKFTDISEGANEYSWNFGDGTTSSQQSPLHHFVKTGHRTVLLEVANSDLCTDTVSHPLLVAFDRLFPPNGFSPNAPTVLSRWNDLIFEAKNEIKGWDGRINNGTYAPAGTYVWILSFTDFLGRKHRQTGTVTLVY
ncbi:MAG: PKD domain-containing protein [Bacteroidia bacterium]|nr:PKD domain-containing protein [Bacteroidia bacterium]